VAAAGGPTASADLTAINLARVLVDGEQVVVPAPGDTPSTGAAPGASGGTGGAAGSGRVDLNRADAAAFDTLPGIGPVLAERIVAWRDEHGRFTAVEELTEVTGIGPALLAGVRDLVQVG
jgi:competence protein ComEA